MFLTRKSSRWANASSLIASRSLFGGIKPENLVILKTVWEKEMSGFAKYCELEGVEKNFVVVKAANSVVASELFLRRDEILKNVGSKKVTFEFTGPATPSIVKSAADAELLYIVMPLRAQ